MKLTWTELFEYRLLDSAMQHEHSLQGLLAFRREGWSVEAIFQRPHSTVVFLRRRRWFWQRRAAA